MKRKIFIDIDGCLLDSISSFCNVYNELYINHPDFIPANPDLVKTWEASEQIPLCQDINELFAHRLFFEFAQPLDKYTLPVLERLSKQYELVVCSIGVPENISRKARFIEKTFPMIKQSIFLSQKNCKMDKSIIDMSKSIFIDDVASNLESSNASLKICIGKQYDWNKHFKGLRCLDWKSVGEILI